MGKKALVSRSLVPPESTHGVMTFCRAARHLLSLEPGRTGVSHVSWQRRSPRSELPLWQTHGKASENAANWAHSSDRVKLTSWLVAPKAKPRRACGVTRRGSHKETPLPPDAYLKGQLLSIRSPTFEPQKIRKAGWNLLRVCALETFTLVASSSRT
jgi:hypothetical protein